MGINESGYEKLARLEFDERDVLPNDTMFRHDILECAEIDVLFDPLDDSGIERYG